MLNLLSGINSLFYSDVNIKKKKTQMHIILFARFLPRQSRLRDI